MTSKKSISIDLSNPFAYEELPPEQYMLLDYLTEGPRAYLSEFLQRMFKQIDKRFPAELSNYKPHHIIAEDSPIGRYFLDEKDDFMKECRRIYPEYTVRWIMPDYDGKNSISDFHFVYPHFPRENRTGQLQELPAGMHCLKGFFRSGETAYSAEDLTVMANPAFRKKPILLLNHYRSHSGQHIVLAGETLSKLSERFYGSVKYWPSLLQENLALIPEGDAKLLKLGTKLHIPKFSEIEVIFKIVGPPPMRVKKVGKQSEKNGLSRSFVAPSEKVASYSPELGEPITEELPRGANFYIGGGGDNYDVGYDLEILNIQKQKASHAMKYLSDLRLVTGDNYYFGHEQQKEIIEKMILLKGPHNLIGHSWGGKEAILITAKVPKGMVKNLITLDPVALVAQKDPKNYQHWINVYQKQDALDMIATVPIVGNIIAGGLDALEEQNGSGDEIATAGGQLGAEDGAVNILAQSDRGEGYSHMAVKEMLKLALEGLNKKLCTAP